MAEKFPLVSIITVNYNQAKITAEWLRSVRKITYPAYEIIIVDNASTENRLEDYIDEWTNIQLVKSSENKGFAGGNNLGIEKARGKYLLFLNNDTEVEAHFLEPLVDCMLDNNAIGMVSPKIKYFYNNNIIQYAGGTKINAFTGRGSFIGNKQEDNDSYSQTSETALIHGAAMLVSRILIKKIGLMDEKYFLYYEELDWCERAKKAGFLLYVVGWSVVYHKESMSVGKNSPLRMYYTTRNRILFMQKNSSGFSFITYLLFFIIFSIPANIIKLLWQKRTDLLCAFVEGVAWHMPKKLIRLKLIKAHPEKGKHKTKHLNYS